jgi:basic membrane protein A and related proteins
MYQPRFLSGLVAGKATKTNKIGYVAAFPIPEVIRGINAFTLGVRTANPDATVTVVWTNTWFGPPEEKEAAEALLDQGATSSPSTRTPPSPRRPPPTRCRVSIGYDSDMRVFVGDTVLTSPIWNWGPKYIEIAKASWPAPTTESYWGSMADGIVDLAPLSPRSRPTWPSAGGL